MTTIIGVETNLGKAWPLSAAFTFRVLVTSDGTASGTPTNLTGRAYTFVVRREINGRVDQSAALLTKTSAASQITYTNGSGTADAADVSILSTDLPAASVNPEKVRWALWRTDDPSDRPEAHGSVLLFEVAGQ